MYTLVFTRTYERAERRFLRRHPDLVERYKRVLQLLEHSPDHPALKLHLLKGNLAGKHAVSVSYRHRIVLYLARREQKIVLLAIGTHDEAYR